MIKKLVLTFSLLLGSVCVHAFPFVPYAKVSQLKVLQVVSATLNTSTVTVGTSYIDTGLDASIVLSSTNSKVLAEAYGTIRSTDTGNSPPIGTIYRGITDLGNANGLASVGSQTVLDLDVPCSLVAYDAPASTATLTYSVQIKGSISTGRSFWNAQSRRSTLLLFEISP